MCKISVNQYIIYDIFKITIVKYNVKHICKYFNILVRNAFKNLWEIICFICYNFSVNILISYIYIFK